MSLSTSIHGSSNPTSLVDSYVLTYKAFVRCDDARRDSVLSPGAKPLVAGDKTRAARIATDLCKAVRPL